MPYSNLNKSHRLVGRKATAEEKAIAKGVYEIAKKKNKHIPYIHVQEWYTCISITIWDDGDMYKYSGKVISQIIFSNYLIPFAKKYGYNVEIKPNTEIQEYYIKKVE